MRILDKYIVKNFLQPFLYCLILFVFLYVIIDLFEHIDDLIKQKIDWYTLLVYYITFIPTIFVQTTPVAMLVATIYSLGNMNKNNEITAMRASGLSFFGIIAPLLLIGFVASILVFIVNDEIVPKASMINTRIRQEKMEIDKKNKQKIIENLALYGTKNRLIFMRSFDTESKKISEIIIQESDESANLLSKIDAKEAQWTGENWLFKNVIISKLGSSGEIVGDPQFFQEKIVDMDETPEDLEKKEWRSEFMNYAELSNYIKQFPVASFRTLKKLRVELDHKIAFPLTSFIVIIAASPFALISRRGGALIGIGLSLLMGLSYYAVMSISLALGKSGLLPAFISAWFANFLYLGIGIYLLRKIS